ncbi:MAG: DUF3343 domain-containing protein [Firmicutes bacterium]|nr:DUF3343 domain-containing protein [Bacillota bacterium]
MSIENHEGKQLLVTFPSTHQALKFERCFKSEGFNFQLMPVPRQISSSCGLAAKVTDLGLDQLLLQIGSAAIEYDAIYLFTNEGRLKCLLKQEE